jgi:hypothetical protein
MVTRSPESEPMLFTLWAYFAFVAVHALTVLGFVISAVQRAVHSMSAFFTSGGSHVCYVASWNGPARPGRPVDGQLCIIEISDRNGDRFSTLMDGNSCPGVERLRLDTLAAETHILDATLTTVTVDGETHTTDMTKLLYSIPDHLSFTPSSVAALLQGARLWDRILSSRLVVTTMDAVPLRFDTEDIVDRGAFFSSHDCNGHEADACVTGTCGSHSGGPVRGDDAGIS